MQDHDPSPTQRTEIELDLAFLDKRIGVPLDPAEVRATLEALGFEVGLEDGHLRVLTPTWRSTGDVSLPEDVLEEVARIHGYESIPPVPLGATFAQLTPTDLRPLDRRVREQLAARAGMREVVTYAWSADRMLEAAGRDPADGIVLVDPPAPDRGTLRPSLVPNLLETAAANLRHQAEFAAFEVGAVFERLPARQPTHAAAVLVGDDGPALFLRAKGVVEMLRRTCQIVDLRLEPEACASEDEGPGWADRGARLALTAHGDRVGTLALLGTRARRMAGLGDGVYVACFEMDLAALTLNPTRENSYRPVSEWPEGEFDLSVVVPEDTTWARLSAHAAASEVPGSAEIARVMHVGEFRGGWVADGDKSVTLRVRLRARSGTLGGGEIAAAREAVIAALSRGVGGRLRES
jgi:phenylalanyl-tRNA synthetase beta chain